MELSHARFLAESVVAKLAPYCQKICICGGIRRHKPDPHDIDIVCLPHYDSEKDMFSNITSIFPVHEFEQAVNQWTKVKGEATGKYTQRLLKDGTKVEISIAFPDNYGCLKLIRTGDADFTPLIMKRALRMGFQQRAGYLWDDDENGMDSKIIPIPEEEDYFRVLNLPFVEPSKRDINAFR